MIGLIRLLVLVLLCVLFAETAAVGQLLQEMEKEFISIAERASQSCVKIEVIERLEIPVIKFRKNKSGDITSADRVPLKVAEKTKYLSGLLYDSEKGYIVTVADALTHAARVSVSFYNLEKPHYSKAKILGSNIESNIGLLQVEGPLPFKALPIGDSGKVRPGSIVMGFGYSYNLGPSPTFSIGVVSATDRTFRTSPPNSGNPKTFFQASFTMHPGETGGPMINSASKVVGLMIAPYPPSEQAYFNDRGLTSQGCTIILPSNRIVKEVEWILAKHDKTITVLSKVKQREPWLGLRASEINDNALRNQLGIDEGGVLIQFVYPDDAASRAGVEPNDVLECWNNIPIKGIDHLKEMINKARVGTKIKLKVIRKSKQLILEVDLGED